MLSNQVIALCSTQKHSSTSRGFLCTHGCEFLVLVVPSRINWASSLNRISCKVCNCSYSHSQNGTWLAWPLGSGCFLFRGDTGRNHHGAKLSIPVPFLHQSSWKFCLHLYLGFVAQLPNIISSTPSLFTFCIREGTSLPQSTEYVLKCCPYFTTAALPFQLQKPHTICMSVNSSFGILTTTALQHNTATQAHRVCKRELSQVTEVPTRRINL
jgi:hypothetical protein